MSFNWRAPGIVWLEHTAETAAVAAATVALSLMTPGGETHASAQTITLLSAKAALYAVLYAIVALRQPNGTASLLSTVRATPRPSKRG
ncbi:hypothetical protein [Mycobacterium celatum]|uniref:Uncharacterized protein n=1 Tax=Mycobacterium celatum TaxID=28045 RepID=A0A2G5PQL3_MYCCE|nr:hypothetical protein [Mycobacterium celatum]PIB80582.1 hypothetical protein CQY23_03305 [Mycobacterium celatum]